MKKYGEFQVRLTTSRTLSSGTLLLIPSELCLPSRSPVFVLSALRHLSLPPAASSPLRVYTVRSLPLEKSDRLIFTGGDSILRLICAYVSCRLGNPCPHYENREDRRRFSIYFIRHLLADAMRRIAPSEYTPFLIHGCKFQS